jgi:prepilin-type N-terminal cleavage/methylation domain-containing protein
MRHCHSAESRLLSPTVKFNPETVMKNPSRQSKGGFTLVELLVVIAIIAVLAAAGFAAGNAAIQKAKKTTAMASCTALESAVNDFFTEYSYMPQENLTTDVTVDTGKADLINVLLGAESGTNILNTRKVKFLSAKEGKERGSGGINGLVYEKSGGKAKGLYDPWGGPYWVMMDGDYDEEIKPKPAGDTANVTLHGRRVAAWTNGADAAPGGTGGSQGDNVITWGK